MTYPKRILFINHAGTLRGASMSLLFTIKGLDADRYQAMVAVAAPEGEVTQFYRSQGLETISEPGILQWHFSTGAPRGWLKPYTWIESWRFLFKRRCNDLAMHRVITALKPDLIHLNSMALAPAALYCRKHNIPFIWHVREPPQSTSRFSLRRRLIGKWLREWPAASIFLSDYDRQTWTGSTTGHVIPNFVDFKAFNREISGDHIRQELHIPLDAPVLVFMGGLRAIKGIFTLIRALHIVRQHYPDIRCIMPGSAYAPPPSLSLKIARWLSPLTRRWPTGHCAIKLIKKLDLEDVCLRLPYRTDVPEIIAAADLMLFPSTLPHFARPAIEASAMGKPVVASNLPGVCELIKDGENGMLVPAGCPEALAQAICDLLKDPEQIRRLGNKGFRLARNQFSRTTACQRIMELYAQTLESAQH